jgi:TET-associated glycosyltransferase-like protein
MSEVVYIPTMGRLANLEKVIPRWLDQDFDVVLVVPESEREVHGDLLYDHEWFGRVSIVAERGKKRGIGYVRKVCVAHAESHGLKSFVMADDDVRPEPDSDMSLLTAAARRPGVLGIGSPRRLTDYYTGGAISRNSGVIMCPGGWGLQLWAMNVETTIKIGNFDEKIHSWGEDAELVIRGIMAGIPWLAHCDVWHESIGKRYLPGGISGRFEEDREARTAAEQECVAYVHSLYPKYTAPPGHKFRVAWQKLLDDHIPDWRSRSAIHGGRLD